MLSYRHAFHAGNHGDVLKHLCQMMLLEKLTEKDKAFVYIDTHSGAGLYDLQSDESQKTSEFEQGIGGLDGYSGANPTIQQYVELISEYTNLHQYPGSPQIANLYCREQDKLILMELHNTEIIHLKKNLKGKNIEIHHRDGYEGLLALLPPTPKRGMVLIDPPYEVADEYSLVAKTMKQALKKWPTGIFTVWYPILSKRAEGKRRLCKAMLNDFSSLDCKNLLSVELCIESEHQDSGMYGSGLAIFNAPWLLDEKLEAVLPELKTLLEIDNSGSSTISWLKQGS